MAQVTVKKYMSYLGNHKYPALFGDEVLNRLKNIEEVANEVLKENGFSYGSKANVERETFPTRVYGEYVLPAGEYSALILRLGSGEGDNWWCVVYPPLCFTGDRVSYVYRSKIKDVIDEFFSKKGEGNR